MEFKEIELLSGQLDNQIRFYNDILEFDTTIISDDKFFIQTQKTKLTFNKTEENHFYHFAFLICENHFEDVLRFVKQKNIELLPDLETGNEIVYWGNAEGKSIYFYDEDKNIVEFIIRPNLGYRGINHWVPEQTIKINEIGTPVENTIKTATYLIDEYKFKIPQKYIQGFDDKFCWFGDFEGTLLIVSTEREWHHTNKKAIPSPLKLVIKEKGETIALEFDGEFKTGANKE